MWARDWTSPQGWHHGSCPRIIFHHTYHLLERLERGTLELGLTESELCGNSMSIGVTQAHVLTSLGRMELLVHGDKMWELQWTCNFHIYIYCVCTTFSHVAV